MEIGLEDRKKALTKAMNLLARQEKTEKQVRAYLAKKEFSNEVIEQVVSDLKEWNYLNDARFASRYAFLRQNRGGKRKVKRELMQKGVTQEQAQAAVEELDEQAERETALSFAQKALRGQTDEAALRRAYGALARRGYEGNIIRYAMKEAIRLVKEEM